MVGFRLCPEKQQSIVFSVNYYKLRATSRPRAILIDNITRINISIIILNVIAFISLLS